MRYKCYTFCFLGKSFRHEQCEAKNGYQSDAKGVKTFVEWVPKYAGVLPGDVCKLTCRAKGTGYYVVFSPKVTSPLCPEQWTPWVEITSLSKVYNCQRATVMIFKTVRFGRVSFLSL